MKERVILTEEQIKKLFLDREIKNLLDEWGKERRKYHEKWKEWINIEAIKILSDKELKEKFLEYYREGAGRHTFNQVFRDRIIRDIKRFRKMLLFLLNEEIPIDKRINQILEKDGKYNIEGVGKALVTSILYDFNSEKYCIWNNKVNAGLEKIGWMPKLKGKKGEKYLQILETLKKLRETAPEDYKNFGDIDLFLHIIAAEPEGERALKRILEEPTEEDEFQKFEMMENELRSFLIKNFEMIFPAWRIYEDEEGKAIEYPTGAGRIDILAESKDGKEKIVIELKGGVATSKAIGQILAYMQWVEKNLLSKSEKVKGVIIARDIDEKLKFALKRVKDVEVFKYSINFKIEKIETKA